MNPIELSIFSSRIEAICDEMGEQLKLAAFSPNIKDRLDFSCAIFDAQGNLCAQAAHIPVHLGSMAYAMDNIIAQCDWHEGDMVILNDPYKGGTHLPDVTLISPFFYKSELLGFIANRAHHADIGADSPGSMPLSRTIHEEGLLIPPTHLMRNHILDQEKWRWLLANMRNPIESSGDFKAQIGANQKGQDRLLELLDLMGQVTYTQSIDALNDYAERLAVQVLGQIPKGEYHFTDYLDDDGIENKDIAIQACIRVSDSSVEVDFTGTAPQVMGNINCSLPVTAAAVFYVLRSLMPAYVPVCGGVFRPIKIIAPTGCLLNAEFPAAVVAGNVETSTRIVDVITGALAQALPDVIPAASHGSMNNVALGCSGESVWDYYETIGGGMGAGPNYPGQHAKQTHMTNTLNTPIEVLEMKYPMRVTEYSIREKSGGVGKHYGGNGIIREFEFLQVAKVTLLTERRRYSAWGLAGGKHGEKGHNWLNGQALPAKVAVDLVCGDRLKIETPGGGAWGESSETELK